MPLQPLPIPKETILVLNPKRADPSAKFVIIQAIPEKIGREAEFLRIPLTSWRIPYEEAELRGESSKNLPTYNKIPLWILSLKEVQL